MAYFFLIASSSVAVPPEATYLFPNRSSTALSIHSMVTTSVMPVTAPIMAILVDSSVPPISIASLVASKV